MNNKRVILGMSGGIDSSLSAFLLKEQGYEVIGITFKVFECSRLDEYQYLESNCCSVENINDAKRMAQLLKIRHYIIDHTKEFNDIVVKNFIDEYFRGRTPNPCIICNKEIKWAKLLQIANEQDAEFIATGHYANVTYNSSSGRYGIRKSFDPSKDQTYALWRLTQEQLSRTIFPLGEYTKERIKQIAFENKLPVAGKHESFEICFIPDNDYNKYLSEKEPERIKNIGNGKIIYKGKTIGFHKGYPFYTIGQRRGLGVAIKEPVYVKNISPEENIIELGTKDELLNRNLIADSLNLVKYESISGKFQGYAKIRYKDPGSPATLEISDKDTLSVEFNEPKSAITPGQSLVFYEGDEIVAGGIIKQSFN